MLTGLIHDGEGRKMSPSHTVKAGKRYRYYVTHPNALIGSSEKPWRVSAPEIERIVIERLKGWLMDHRAIIDIAGPEHAVGADQSIPVCSRSGQGIQASGDADDAPRSDRHGGGEHHSHTPP
ncbi:MULTISPECIES: hypothetical protein [unclassified Sphingobium]|uniref:hypothetical protein n=1 Tax=unclassified Sphingobium TaxID=2611147 RepID=UPI0022240997|nr:MULTISPECIES: hypothetical protein [unclassified Sphingobium]